MARRKTKASIPAKDAVIWRAALYIRLSREDGNDVSYSVKNQLELLHEYVAQNCQEFRVIDSYIDDGYTGIDTNRNGIKDMLSDIENGKINCVIVKDLSRLTRSVSDTGAILERFFPTHNVRFISLGNPWIDSYKDPASMESIIVQFHSMVNEDFCRQTSRKVRMVFDGKKRRGEFIGAFAPYGYKKHPDNKNLLVIDEEAASVVRDIFAWYRGGMSKSGIAKRLNELGIPNPTTYKRLKGYRYKNPHNVMSSTLWQPKTIHDILRNQVYVGNMVQGKQKTISYKLHGRISIPEEEWIIVEKTHAPIIEEEAFALIQDIAALDTRTAPSRKELSLFAGMVKCGDCGHAMHRKTNGSRYYYHCRTYTSQSKSTCAKHTIREDVLESAVLHAIRAQIALVDNLPRLVEEVGHMPQVSGTSHGLDILRAKHQTQLGKTQKALKSLYFDWKNDAISKAEYLSMKAEFTHEAQALEKMIQRLEEEYQAAKAAAAGGHPVFRHFQQHYSPEALERGILVELVDRILVYEGGQIEIQFKFADQYKQMLEYI